MLKFLIDESSGKKLFSFLLQKGFDVKFVGDIMLGSSDENILNLAEKENRILITNDKDFGELVFRFKMQAPGIILLRLKNDSPLNRQGCISYLVKNFYNKIENNFIVLSESYVRMRSLK